MKQKSNLSLDEIRKIVEVAQLNKVSSKTTHELIGDVVFPVTRFSNGVVIVDYPNQPFIRKKS